MMLGCRSSCRHRLFVDEYRRARELAELEREAATLGYAAELAEYGPVRMTFRRWLEETAGRSGEQPA
jgi:hypothetical protein